MHQSPVTVALFWSKTRWGKIHDYQCFRKARFSKKPAFSDSSGLKSVFENLRTDLLLMNKESQRKSFQSAALFLWFGLPSTLIRQENGAFEKRFSNRSNLKTWVFVLVCTENVLKTELFKNNDITIIMLFPNPCFRQTQVPKFSSIKTLKTHVLSKAWFSLATQVQAQAQAIGMTQVKTKFDANTSTSKLIRTHSNFPNSFGAT